MKNTMLTLLFAALLFAFSSCHKISGEGPVITKSLGSSGFTAINSSLDAEVYYTQENVYKVEIHAQANIMNRIKSSVVNGELQLQYDNFLNIGRHEPITIYISAPSVSGLSINGSGHLYSLQAIKSGSINLKVNGSGKINLTSLTGSDISANISGSGQITVSNGAVSTEELHISGSGTMDLLNISALHVTTNTSGSGNISVNAANILDVHISGSGDVYYTGTPAVNSSISGSGKVHHI